MECAACHTLSPKFTPFCQFCGAPKARQAPAPAVHAPGADQPQTTGVIADHRIKCRFCAELILPDATKCRHCGEWLSKAPASTTGVTLPATLPFSRGQLTIVIAGLIAVVAFFMPWYRIGGGSIERDIAAFYEFDRDGRRQANEEVYTLFQEEPAYQEMSLLEMHIPVRTGGLHGTLAWIALLSLFGGIGLTLFTRGWETLSVVGLAVALCASILSFVGWTFNVFVHGSYGFVVALVAIAVVIKGVRLVSEEREFLGGAYSAYSAAYASRHEGSGVFDRLTRSVTGTLAAPAPAWDAQANPDHRGR